MLLDIACEVSLHVHLPATGGRWSIMVKKSDPLVICPWKYINKVEFLILYFSPCYWKLYSYFWVLPGVRILYADVSEHSVPSSWMELTVFRNVGMKIDLPVFRNVDLKMVQGSETSAWTWNLQIVPKRRHEYGTDSVPKCWHEDWPGYVPKRRH